MAVSEITDASFEAEVLKHDKPVLVDFYAPWCGPCKLMDTSLADLDRDLGQKLKIVKLNLDDNPSAALKFGVRSVPTLAIFSSGALQELRRGALTKTILYTWVGDILGVQM